jgi:hypothetical protein
MRRVLHVERVSEVRDDPFGGDEDDDGHEP